MFEQSILQPETDKKRWTFAASILVEVGAVSILMLVPLIYTERLGLGWIQSNVLHVPSPPSPPPMHRRAPDEQQVLTRRAPRPFDFLAAPRSIPTRIVLIDVDQAMPPPCSNCVVGAPPIDGVSQSLGLAGQTTVAPPPKPQPKPAEVKKPVDLAPIKVSLGAQEARIIRRVIPMYPTLARQARVQGTVKLLGVISTEGRIERLQVISGHPLLVRAAVDAVQQWTYRPTLLNGQPVEVQAPIDVNFILSN